MGTFILGLLCGAGGMYLGSDKVADNLQRAAFYSEQNMKNKQYIDQRAKEKIAQWAYEGTLNQHLRELLPQFSQQFPPSQAFGSNFNNNNGATLIA